MSDTMQISAVLAFVLAVVLVMVLLSKPKGIGQ